MKSFLEKTLLQSSPQQRLVEFLSREKALEEAKQYRQQRFVGYALEIGYEEATIITSDPFKVAVGGIPRNSFLIMVPHEFEDGVPYHFILLRVLRTTETPLSREVQQTYFELQKRSMPEIDRFTQAELQWSALKAEVLGMFYAYDSSGSFEFSADLNIYLAAHKYRIYSPDKELLDLIVNMMIPSEGRFRIGKLRLTENMIGGASKLDVDVFVSTDDFKGTRTALFGKTRLGKSNTIKILVKSLIETTRERKNVGQLIFDINGEYANENPQNRAIQTVFPDDCVVYSITPKQKTESRNLRINFYEFPARSHAILAELLRNDRKDTSSYVKSFLSVSLPELDELSQMDRGQKLRARRKILMYWCILKRAGFEIKDDYLMGELKMNLDPKFSKELRLKLYGSEEEFPKFYILQTCLEEVELLIKYHRRNSDDVVFKSKGSGNALLDSDDLALLEFLLPKTGLGPKLLMDYRIYHDTAAGNFSKEILDFLDAGKVVILDLGNAHPLILDYYSTYLSKEIFSQQVQKFSNNELGDKYIQLFFEEAHNLFPNKETSEVDIYRRIAKEGAKYNIGMVYSTQSVSSIHPDLLAQTENFFIAHISSEREVDTLARLNVEFKSCTKDILRLRRKGFMRILTRSHRYTIPVQIDEFR